MASSGGGGSMVPASEGSSASSPTREAGRRSTPPSPRRWSSRLFARGPTGSTNASSAGRGLSSKRSPAPTGTRRCGARLCRLGRGAPSAPHPRVPPPRREPHRPSSRRLVPPSVPRRHEGGEVLLPFDAPAEVHLDHSGEEGQVPLVLHGRHPVHNPLPSVHGESHRWTSAMKAGIACTLPVAFFGRLPLPARGLCHAHLHRGGHRPSPRL